MRDGKLKWRLDRRPGSDKPSKVFSAGEVEGIGNALALADQNASELARVKSEERAMLPAVREGAVAIMEDLNAVKKEIAAMRAESAKKEALWLTLDEAAAYSRLAKAYLLRAIRQKRLVAVKAPSWRIRRASLEVFEG
jgi:Helix-turn-helix domain